MIADTKYYLGGSNIESGSAETYYNWERGTTVYSGRSTSWNGRIALIYPSDNAYTYALGVDNVCYNDHSYYGCGQSSGKINSWLYNSNYDIWSLSPNTDDPNDMFCFNSTGSMSECSSVGSNSVRPTLYLSSQVKITSGDGSEANPYQLSL